MVQAKEAAIHLVLPIDRSFQRGTVGLRTGRESGISPNFREHRLYLPGDDVRHLDWRVAARTGKPVLRLFDQEVSPVIDFLIDPSASMELTASKRRRVIELAAFVVESARRERMTTRIWLVGGAGVKRLLREDFERGWEIRCQGIPPFEAVPLCTGSFRVVLSDLLFDKHPGEILRGLSRDASGLLLIVPWTAEEAEPDWKRMDLIEDCESGDVRTLRTDAGVRAEYHQAYQRHFDNWSAMSRATGAYFARVSDRSGLLEELEVAWQSVRTG
ncbi:MAG: DUF58 domain-containing protein [Verrucomicrobiia bacterium]